MPVHLSHTADSCWKVKNPPRLTIAPPTLLPPLSPLPIPPCSHFHQGAAYLVTEYCENGNLSEYLMSERVMTWKMRLGMLTGTARGMLYLHQKANIIQRDLKSENLLIDEHGVVKIADFGLSRALAPEGDMGTFCGTPTHVAPEIVRQEEYSEKADVFSFGIIMWELTTREMPYPGQEGLQVAYKVANENLRPPVPSYCPDEIADLMQRCWDDDARKRPTYKEIMNELTEVRVEQWWRPRVWCSSGGVVAGSRLMR